MYESASWQINDNFVLTCKQCEGDLPLFGEKNAMGCYKLFKSAAVSAALGLPILVVPRGVDAKDLRQVIELAARKLLQQPPFPPTDINLFTQQSYPSSKPMVPATSSKYKSEGSLRGLIASTLAKRADEDHQIVKQGLADFDDPQLKQVIPDARLRAGLATLEGTIGESAIAAIRSGIYNQARFGDFDDPSAVARVGCAPAAGGIKPDIVFNGIYQYEDPRLRGTILSHETLHQDPQNSNTEELIANYLQTLTYGEELLEDPGLAHAGTSLARVYNTLLMGVINDRNAQGYLRLETSQGNLYPRGSVAVLTFASVFNPQPADNTSGNAHLDETLTQATGTEVTNARFNQTTIDLLDQNQKLFSPTEIIAIAVILGLRV